MCIAVSGFMVLPTENLTILPNRGTETAAGAEFSLIAILTVVSFSAFLLILVSLIVCKRRRCCCKQTGTNTAIMLRTTKQSEMASDAEISDSQAVISRRETDRFLGS